MKKNTKFVGNRIPIKIYRKIEEYSYSTGLKKQRIMTDALTEYFNRRENINEPQENKGI